MINESKQLHISIEQADMVARGYLNAIREAKAYNDDDEDARRALYELIENLLSQKVQSGSPDEFHNLAASLGKEQENLLACQVLECALQRYPRNVNLLADYLLYGMDCEKMEECQKYYETLCKIPRRNWSWRGFSFAAAYVSRLLDSAELSNEEYARYTKERAQLSAEYRKYFPHDEESYRVKAMGYRGEEDRELRLLAEALEDPELGPSPRCALRYADVLFGRKQYHKALEAVRRGLAEANQTQGKVDEFYLYYLSGLCKLAILMSEETVWSREAVEDIYMDFNVALVGLRNSNYAKTIQDKTLMLYHRTGYEVPPERCRKLTDFIGEY